MEEKREDFDSVEAESIPEEHAGDVSEDAPSGEGAEGSSEESDGSASPSSEGRTVEVSLRSVRFGALAVLAALAIGVGGYLIGKGTGEDLDAARVEGATAGKRAGAAKGSAKGFSVGFKNGRETAYKKKYGRAYKKSYAKAFEEAGLEPPKARDIDVPKQ